MALSPEWVQTPIAARAASTFASVAVDAGGNAYAAGSIRGTDPYDFDDSVTAAGACTATNVLLVKYDSTGNTKWARTAAVATGSSAFTGVVADASGNVFAVGTITGSDPYDFGDSGNSVEARSPYAFGNSLVIVNYDANNGTAKWAHTVRDAPGASSYAAIAVDQSGNLYAAGTIVGNSQYDLGDGKTVAGILLSGKSALLVKYSAAGTTQWAQSLQSGSGESSFAAVALDGSGHPYVAGHIFGTQTFGFGNSVTATGTGSLNALLASYNASGIAQWARTATSGGNSSDFTAVAVDGTDNVLAAGSISGHTANSFGTGASVAGAYATGPSVLLVKYDSSGTALWGQSVVSATGLSGFASLALDPAGPIYAAGMLAGPGSYDFGNSMVVTTASDGNEVLIAKYDSAGTCHGAQTAATGSSSSGFSAATADSAANIYAAGTINGPDWVDLGNSTKVSGAYHGGNNAILVKYQ